LRALAYYIFQFPEEGQATWIAACFGEGAEQEGGGDGTLDADPGAGGEFAKAVKFDIRFDCAFEVLDAQAAEVR
jgi:hypothetical protein